MIKQNHNGSLVAIASYKPKEGKDEGMRDVIKSHMPVLLKEDLVTSMPAIVLRSNDGTYIEIFEWKSSKAIEDAHHNPNVLALWKRFEEVCTYTNLADLEECKNMFATFEPVKL